MPRHLNKKGSPISERMPSPYRAKRIVGHYQKRGADLPRFVVGKVKESFGACKNSTVRVKRDGRQTTKCKSYRVILGNDLCQGCWDKEIDSRSNNNPQRKGLPKLPEMLTDR
jgi:hypothetical protein